VGQKAPDGDLGRAVHAEAIELQQRLAARPMERAPRRHPALHLSVALLMTVLIVAAVVLTLLATPARAG
jgi:hypothetical protein